MDSLRILHMFHEISSPQNPHIKQIIKLQSKHQERRETGLLVVEGLREISLAIQSGYKPNSVYFSKQVSEKAVLDQLLAGNPETEIFYLSAEAFSRIAYRESTSGALAVFQQTDHDFSKIRLTSNPLVVVLESIEKPGNLGAILRTADAAAIDAVIICDPLSDIYNPNVIRASIGTVFTNQIVTCSSDDAMHWLERNNFNTYAAELTASSAYHLFDYTQPTAFVMGTEASGLTEQWLSFCNHNIIIPMMGKIDSLNVSTSTAILVFEAMRQRNFQK